MEALERIGARLAIEARAEALATKYCGGPPVDLDTVAHAVGILDIALADIDSAARLINAPIDGFWAAVIRQDDPFVRRRFSLAHEIAHLALGLVGDERRYRGEVAARDVQNATERACDYFAACLLMPRSWVVKRVPRATDAIELARVFDVSRKSMRIRLRELGFHELANTPKAPPA